MLNLKLSTIREIKKDLLLYLKENDIIVIKQGKNWYSIYHYGSINYEYLCKANRSTLITLIQRYITEFNFKKMYQKELRTLLGIEQ
jgi:hypothetical protein